MKTVSIFIILFVYFPMQMLHSQTIQVLRERESYFHLAKILQQKYATKNLTKEITFEYSFVTIILKTPFENEINTWLSVRISKEFAILEVVCMNKEVEKEVIKLVSDFEKSNVKDIDNQWFKQIYTVETQQCLVEADHIAKIGSICGGTYAPSYYSKIQINETTIFLEQIDYQNAKSLDKGNYAMRRLFFEITYLEKTDLGDAPLEIAYQYQYKAMKIGFDDHSSPSYKECGKGIAQAIKELANK